jgi:hypothetical protein
MSDLPKEPFKRKVDLPRGVYLSRDARYMAVVRHHGKRHYLGMFGSPEEAGERVTEFRKENPMGVRKWMPGDAI